VPYENDIGYRELPYTDLQLERVFKKMQAQKDGNSKVNFDQMDELNTLVTYANDEGDPGMGLQLGLDMFSSASHRLLQREAYKTLSMAYTLLDRGLFCDIAKIHIKNRYRPSLSQLDS